MLNELYWFSRRALLIVGLLIAFLLILAYVPMPQNVMILLAMTVFVLAHLWLLAWLTFKIQPMVHHGKLVSVQIRWREGNKVMTHFWLNRHSIHFLAVPISNQ